MKLDLYIDVWAGNNPQYLTATASPSKKRLGSKRYKITVSIPDEAFTGVIDGELTVDGEEVDKD